MSTQPSPYSAGATAEALQSSAELGQKLIPVLSIVESKTNPRKHFDGAYIDRLADSIRSVGVLSPILVRPNGDGYELVCGHCRVRAGKVEGLRAIPAIVRDLDDLAVLEAQLIENLHRSDLHPLEEAAGYHALMAAPHKYTATMIAERTATMIAERTGRSVKYVYDRIKLLELTNEAQKLFLADRITAGHAILLARLSPKDQERVIGGEDAGFRRVSGLFTDDRGLFDEDGDEEPPTKAVSVRELERWIDEHVRFDRKLIEPLLYPETAERVEAATASKTKLIPITHDFHVNPEAKADGERTYGPMSWKRADGVYDSKTCEHSILGVIVVGRGRGEAFNVCIAKDKCKTHWAKEAAAKKRAATQRENGGADKKPAGKPSWQIEEEKRKAKAAVWEKVAPAVLEAFAEAVKKAPTKATGPLAQIIMGKLYIRQTKVANELIPLGTTAEEFIRHVAFAIISDQVCDPYNADRDAPKLGKAFGIDVAAVVKRNTPKIEKPAAPAKVRKSKRKAS